MTQTNETIAQKIEREKRERIEQATAPIRARMAVEEQRKAEAKAAQAQAQAERVEQQRAAQEEQIKAAARARWIANAGKPSEFESAWPEIRKTMLIAATAQDTESERQRRDVAARFIRSI